MAEASKRPEPLTCSMCLEAFDKPKILPCFHSFCEKCLHDLATRSGGKNFACPNCRKNIRVPKNGVGDFQDNFYLDLELQQQLMLKINRKRIICEAHPKCELISYCVTCSASICVECMLGDHKPHHVETLAKVANFARQNLEADKQRLQLTLTRFGQKAKAVRDNKELLADAVHSVRAEIHTKYAQLVSLAEKHRDDELARLDRVADTLGASSRDATALAELREGETSVVKMEEEVNETLDKGSDLEVILLATDMRFGRGSEQSLRSLLPNDWPKPITALPALQTRFSLDADITLIQSTVGTVTTRDASQVQPGVKNVLQKIRSALMFSS